MRLNSLRLQNFRQHAETWIEFDVGLTGVIGPNGAGKSTILEAIAWALYGQPAARGTRDTLRFARAEPRATVRVELDFELAGHRYRVARGLTSAEAFLDGRAEPVASSITGVTEFLQKRLGMTRAEFFNTFFTGQKELSVMASMAPSERSQFLSRVLGYEKLRGAQALVRDRRKLIVAEIAGVRSATPDPEGVARALGDARARVAETGERRAAATTARREADAAFALIAPQWDSAQQSREALQQLLSDLRVAESDEAGRARDLERIDGELEAIAGARLEMEDLATRIAPLSEVLEEYRRLEELAREEGRRQTLTDTERSLHEELERLAERRARIARAPQMEEEVTEALERKRNELEEALGVIEARRTEWVRDRQEAETRRDALRRQYQELKTQRDRIVDLGEDGVCPTCTRVLGPSFRTVLDQLEEQLETIAVDGRYFSTRLEQLEEMPAEIAAVDQQRRTLTQEVATLERQLARVQSAVQELAQVARDLELRTQRLEAVRKELAAIPVGYDAGRHAELQQQTAQLAPLNERVARLSAQIEREPQLRRDRDRVAGERDTARSRREGLRARYDETHFSEEDFARLRLEHDEAAVAARSAEVALGVAEAEWQAAVGALAQAERAQADLERAAETEGRLVRERRLHDELDRFYTDLRTDLNFELRPELAARASDFLRELTDGRYAELDLDDQYNVVLLEDARPRHVISGGEEDLASLVLRLAISQMIAERAGQAFSLLVLDEIFGSLDAVRQHGVVDLLRRLQDRFEQVIVITHIESVREELDRVLSVSYDEESGASRVRLVEPTIQSLDDLAVAGASLAEAEAHTQ